MLDEKIRVLQDKGLGNPKKSDGLTINKITQILDHPYMDTNDNESFTHHTSFSRKFAEYCKISNDQSIMNLVMLILFSFEDLNLDKYNYSNEYRGLIEEVDEDDKLETQLPNYEIQETQPPNYESQNTQVPNYKIQKTQLSSVKNRLRIPRPKLCPRTNPYLASLIMPPFKLLYHSDSSIIAKYGKKKKTFGKYH
ncbi:482_t:CDS:2 [Cetraspora pellucida]|uniref:482_t:CDS:1 n=1 Tax=Cetraspora pellucida TaxID=1433469 RepID=A0A9N8Z334_9GLOM|nr:482_t:CDS:2 [Cetraspora pellucida]